MSPWVRTTRVFNAKGMVDSSFRCCFSIPFFDSVSLPAMADVVLHGDDPDLYRMVLLIQVTKPPHALAMSCNQHFGKAGRNFFTPRSHFAPAEKLVGRSCGPFRKSVQFFLTAQLRESGKGNRFTHADRVPGQTAKTHNRSERVLRVAPQILVANDMKRQTRFVQPAFHMPSPRTKLLPQLIGRAFTRTRHARGRRAQLLDRTVRTHPPMVSTGGRHIERVPQDINHARRDVGGEQRIAAIRPPPGIMSLYVERV